MRFFGIGRKRTKRVKRQPNAEQMSRNAELKRKRFVAESFIDMAKQDPEWRRQMVAEEYKLKLPSKDPAAEQRKEIEALLSGLVVKELKENPELAKKVVDTRIAQLTNPDNFLEYADGEPSYPGNTIGQVLEEIEDLEELKTRLGSGKGSAWIDAFKDPEVIASLLSSLQSILRGSTPQAAEPVVMVQVDGVPTTVTQSQLQKLQQEGRVRPVTAIESPKIDKELPVDKASPEIAAHDKPPKSDHEEVEVDTSAAKVNEPELPSNFDLIDLNKLIGYLDVTTAEAVERLEAEKQREKQYAQTLWVYLEDVEYENLIRELEVYKDHSTVGPYVELLLSDKGKMWISEVLCLVKQRAGSSPQA